ncbi:MAG: Xaa-Pro peptidase family protein [Treponema sp.]|jgi:Xaa-Pro dipeptidase|nr:Xaa-Pro peptidase family protein [Treponema sp.]
MDANAYSVRMKKVREEMAKAGIDVFLVSPSSNLLYLTGYTLGPDERLFLLVLPLEEPPFLIANLLYKEQTKSLPVTDQVFWKDGENAFDLLKTEIAKRSIQVKKAALEPQIPAFFALPLGKIFPNLELGSPLIEPLRQYKDESELELIRKACRESDRALGALIDKGSYWMGKTESDFLMELTVEFSKGTVTSAGASVQVGANAAIPHYTTGAAIIKEGACLLCDYWGRYEGYFTDCTRTFHFGKPESEFEKIYAIVLEAHLAAEAKAVPGNLLEDVDIAARAVIEKHGYGEYFNHRTGHGLGIDVHEGDSVNTGVKVPIKPGMVFTIEPGIYIPGRLGVRIENLVAIGEKGPEILHNYPRELKVID